MGDPKTGRGIGLLLALCAAAGLAACGGNKSELRVNSNYGPQVLGGAWSTCSATTTGYKYERFSFSGNLMRVEIQEPLSSADCAGAGTPAAQAAAPLLTLIYETAADGEKAVPFSSDGVSADTAPPVGLLQPVQATKLRLTLSATTDPAKASIGSEQRDLLYANYNAQPNVLFRDHNSAAEADGYAAFLSTVDVLVRQF